MKRTKRNILIEFVGQRLLTTDEAEQVRATVAALKPKMHLVMANWRWLECRGLGEAKAKALIETLEALPGVRFKELRG